MKHALFLGRISLGVCPLLLVAGMVLSCGQEPVSRTSCSENTDCASGICAGGYCLDAPLADYGDVSGSSGSQEDASAADGDSGATTDGVATVDASIRDTGAGNDPTETENPCGGTSTLDGRPGEPCGPCEDGEWECADEESVACVDASVGNACGGCGDLPHEPNSPCDECPGGVWICLADGEMICQCPGNPGEGTCDSPRVLQLGDELDVDLCAAEDNNGNIAGPEECNAYEIEGSDVVFQFTLARREPVRIEMYDSDSNRVIDTLIYLRNTCSDASSQIFCSDDRPCDESNEGLGPCVGDRQPRHSLMEVELDAGTYYLIADSWNYSREGIGYGCGRVHLELKAGTIEF